MEELIKMTGEECQIINNIVQTILVPGIAKHEAAANFVTKDAHPFKTISLRKNSYGGFPEMGNYIGNKFRRSAPHDISVPMGDAGYFRQAGENKPAWNTLVVSKKLDAIRIINKTNDLYYISGAAPPIG